MPIKNYTSKVSVYDSLGEIQAALAKNGARKIIVDYDDKGRPNGVAFAIEAAGRTVGFILPANIDGVVAVFKREKLKVDTDQAERTAWRNIRDWVQAQMAFIESGNVEMVEVFMPYIADKTGTTLYQLFRSGQLALPDGGG